MSHSLCGATGGEIDFIMHSGAYRVQPTVTFQIGGHVNVLQNYKKT